MPIGTDNSSLIFGQRLHHSVHRATSDLKLRRNSARASGQTELASLIDDAIQKMALATSALAAAEGRIRSSDPSEELTAHLAALSEEAEMIGDVICCAADVVEHAQALKQIVQDFCDLVR